ncbi:hypothetical protein BaRGS_00006957 [Batillaria attramentaria]|uniref:Uncharacterized protein n=1 Tax=Batillaria attramentaria TaxID=370345 RepID=A0ABD0LRR9_9CAEN
MTEKVGCKGHYPESTSADLTCEVCGLRDCREGLHCLHTAKHHSHLIEPVTYKTMMDVFCARTMCRRCFGILSVGLSGGKGLSVCAGHGAFSSRRLGVASVGSVTRAFSGLAFQRVSTAQSPRLFLQGNNNSTFLQLQRQLATGTKKKGGLVVVAGLGGILLLGLQYVRNEKELAIAKERSKTLGKARLGGDWELVDSSGRTVTNKGFLGKWVLLYFGFTHCPDICPDELEKMCEVVEKIDALPGVPSLQPVFITVDPDRDTPEAVGEYVKEFSPKLIGLTGTLEQVNNATRAYRVYYSMGPKDEDNDYIVDHTIIMYLINADGEFVDYYGQNKNANQITSSIAMHMRKYAVMS